MQVREIKVSSPDSAYKSYAASRKNVWVGGGPQPAISRNIGALEKSQTTPDDAIAVGQSTSP